MRLSRLIQHSKECSNEAYVINNRTHQRRRLMSNLLSGFCADKPDKASVS